METHQIFTSHQLLTWAAEKLVSLVYGDYNPGEKKPLMSDAVAVRELPCGVSQRKRGTYILFILS